MPRQDLHYLGDYGQDFVAVVRYFVQNFFLAHEIETLFVHDGGYNPAKAATQQSRRATRALLTGDLILRVFARLRGSSETRNKEDTSESFLDLAHGLTKGLREEDVRVAEGTGVTAALYLLLDELDATSHAQGGVRVRQVNTIMEADAYIARTCMRGAYTAILSSDSDFLVLDTPWIPLQSIQHRYAPTACPCSWVPPGRFSEVLYALAWDSLLPFLRLAGMVTSQRPTIPHCSLAGFRKLLGDLATLLGNDFYSLADAGNAVGQVTVRLTGRGEALGQKDGGHCPPPPSCMPSTPVALTCKLTDKVACARFLLVCLCNGWVEEPGGSLALAQDSVILPSLLFPQAPRRQAQYVRARSQYDLEGPMARHQVPSILSSGGMAAQYVARRGRHHHANLLCTGMEAGRADGPEGGGGGEQEGGESTGDEVEESQGREQGAGAAGEGGGRGGGNGWGPRREEEGEERQGTPPPADRQGGGQKKKKKGETTRKKGDRKARTDEKEERTSEGRDARKGESTCPTIMKTHPRIHTLAALLPLQLFRFPMTNLTLLRRVQYELIFLRAHPYAGLDFIAELGAVEIIEEWARVLPQTGEMDANQPFQAVRVPLCEEKGAESAGQEDKDWRLSQSTRLQKYCACLGEDAGPGTLSFFCDLFGYSFPGSDAGVGEGSNMIEQVVGCVLGPREGGEGVVLAPGVGRGVLGCREKTESVRDQLTAEALVFVLSLRTLILAYGQDDGLSLQDGAQRNHGAYKALLRAAAATLLQWTERPLPTPAPFEPTDRFTRPLQPPWLVQPESGKGLAMRLRSIAFLLSYRTCLHHVLALSDTLGRVLHPPRPLAVDLSHTVVQHFVGEDWRDPEGEEGFEKAGGMDRGGKGEGKEGCPSSFGEARIEGVTAALGAAVTWKIKEEMRVWHPDAV